MKLERLILKAYGHFTDCALDFTSPLPGLHIVYGANEAGKSTALRALHGLLYGIPVRTGDNFHHDYSRLLIGGTLTGKDGSVLSFWRRKKNIGDLLDDAENILDPSSLTPYLQQIDEALFRALFGIDHETLVSGGRDILEQKGDVGQALFSAGAGLASLHGLIDGLEKECDNLFKSGGSRPQLNQAIKAYQEIKKEIRTLALSASVWKEAQQRYETVSAQLHEVEQRRLAIHAELERLKRLKQVLPYLVRREHLQQVISSLGEFHQLPADFSEQVTSAFATRAQLAEQLRDIDSRQELLQQKRSRTLLRQEILDQSAIIDALHQRLDTRQSALRDRPGINAELIACRTQAATLLNQAGIGLDLVDTARIQNLLQRRQKILPLANKYAGIAQRLRQATDRVRSLKTEQENVADQLALIPETGDLRSLAAAITTAQRAGDVDAQLQQLDQAMRALDSQHRSELAHLGLLKRVPEQLSTLPVPSAVAVEAFVDQERELAETLRLNRAEQQKVQSELERLQRDISVIEQTGAVPTESELEQIRARRDQGWDLVKQVWLVGESSEQKQLDYTCGEDLPSVFEQDMTRADEVADRLRLEADRVHQYAGLCAALQQQREQWQRLQDEVQIISEQQRQFESAWQQLWQNCELSPRSPREMRSWLDQYQLCCRTQRDLQQKENERQAVLEQTRNLRKPLLAAVEALDRQPDDTTDGLTAPLIYAENLHAEQKQQQERRQTLLGEQRRCEKELAAATTEQQAAQQQMTDWSQQWQTALDGFGLPEDATVDDAVRVLDALQGCLDQRVLIAGYEQRLASIDRHVEEFDKETRLLVTAVAPELDDFSSDQAVVKLQALLRQAEKAAAMHEQLLEDQNQLEENRRQCLAAQQRNADQLSRLRQQALCETDDALLKISEGFSAQQERKKELRACEETLLELTEGVDIELLEAQRQELDPDQLPGHIAALEHQLREELDPQIKQFSEQRGEARNQLQSMDGSSKAAQKEDEAQAALAKVRRLADRYLRVRLGSRILKREIENYRREHQDPILKSASTYFQQLTLGAFTGLRSDLDDSGQPILVGIAGDDIVKTVDAMSSGTRDQLYLALRLATLEWRLEQHEPMPFIADDILINFDDERSRATLDALARLARRNQVILFSHHRQIVDAAEALQKEGQEDHIVIHQL